MLMTISNMGLTAISGLKSLRCQMFRAACVSKRYNVQSLCSVSRSTQSQTNTLVGHWLKMCSNHVFFFYGFITICITIWNKPWLICGLNNHVFFYYYY